MNRVWHRGRRSRPRHRESEQVTVARPIHLEHGPANIQWDRTADWVARNLVDRLKPIAAGDGWREESTGLHPLELIETRRHWFTAAVEHETGVTLNVLNLVEGAAALVEARPMPLSRWRFTTQRRSSSLQP
jgi:hypothetical protein